MAGPRWAKVGQGGNYKGTLYPKCGPSISSVLCAEAPTYRILLPRTCMQSYHEHIYSRVKYLYMSLFPIPTDMAVNNMFVDTRFAPTCVYVMWNLPVRESARTLIGRRIPQSNQSTSISIFRLNQIGITFHVADIF